MAEPLIRIENLEKIYHRDQIEIPVLMGINLAIPEGEYVALMRQLLGILQQDTYHALVDALPGYDARDTGRIEALRDAFPER